MSIVGRSSLRDIRYSLYCSSVSVLTLWFFFFDMTEDPPFSMLIALCAKSAVFIRKANIFVKKTFWLEKQMRKRGVI